MIRRRTVQDAKIHIPSVPDDCLVREELLGELEQPRFRAVVVAAGAGYGKTILLAQHAHRTKDRVAWYHADASDNDAMRFARHLRESILLGLGERPAGAGAAASEKSRAQQTDVQRAQEGPGTGSDAWALIAEALRAAGERRLSLILDDFQLIESEKSHQLLSRLILSAPQNLRVLVACRDAVPALFARFIVAREALVLTPERLKFSREETEQVIRRILGKMPEEEIVRAILRRAEGWPVGVMFCCIYLESAGSRCMSLPAHLQGTALHDYILFEVYRMLPFDIQTFLRRTSVPDQLNDSLCSRIMGVERSGHLLSYLERNNLFTLRIEGAEPAFRYHAIFREYLQSLVSEEERLEIRGIEYHWQLQQGNLESAVECAIACSRPDWVQTALGGIGFRLLEEKRFYTIGPWIAWLSARGVPLTALVEVLSAAIRLREGNPEEELPHLQAAMARYRREVGETAWMRASASISGFLRDACVFEESLRLAEALSAQSIGGTTKESDEERLRLAELRVTDLVFLSRYREAEALCQEVLETAVRSGSERWTARLRRTLGRIAWYRGKLMLSRELLEGVEDDEIGGSSEFGSPRIRNYLASIDLLQGDFVSARSRLSDEMNEGSAAITEGDRCAAYIVWAEVHLCESLLPGLDEARRMACRDEIRRSLDWMERRGAATSDARMRLRYVQALRPLLTEAAGIVDPAVALPATPDSFDWRCSTVESAGTLSETDKDQPVLPMLGITPQIRDFRAASMAMRALAAGSDALAGAWSERCLEESGDEGIAAAVCLGVLAIVRMKAGARAQSLSLVRRMMAWCGENGAVLPFLMFRRLHPALQLAEQHGIAQDFTAHVRSLLNVSQPRLVARCFGEFAVYRPLQENDVVATKAGAGRRTKPGKGAGGMGDGESGPQAVEEVHWRTHKARELFAYLIHLRGAGVRKNALLALLWPDTAPENATDLLHTTLYGIRRNLPEPFRDIVSYNGREYRIDPDRLVSGLDEAETILGAPLPVGQEGISARMEQLTRIGCGYMGGIDGEWALNPREHYHLACVGQMCALAEEANAEGLHVEAIRLWETVVREEPYEEKHHVALMACFRQAGHIGRMHAQYHALSELLRRDLDATPCSETIQAYKKLADDEEMFSGMFRSE